MKARIMNSTVLSHCSAYDAPRPITFFLVTCVKIFPKNILFNNIDNFQGLQFKLQIIFFLTQMTVYKYNSDLLHHQNGFHFCFIAKLSQALGHTFLCGLFLDGCLFHDSACVHVALDVSLPCNLGVISSVQLASLCQPAAGWGMTFINLALCEQDERWHCKVSVIQSCRVYSQMEPTYGCPQRALAVLQLECVARNHS